jgi:hypothetical protein
LALQHLDLSFELGLEHLDLGGHGKVGIRAGPLLLAPVSKICGWALRQDAQPMPPRTEQYR